MKRASIDWSVHAWRALLVGASLALWHALTAPGLLPNLVFSNDGQAAFFFGQPTEVATRLWSMFATGQVLPHLMTTLLETALAFAIGTSIGLVGGLVLALNPRASAVAAPFIKAVNAMPRLTSSTFSQNGQREFGSDQ